MSETSEDFRDFLGLLPDAAIVFDKKGRILEVNGAMERLSGYEKQDLVGADFKGLKLFTRQGRKILKDNLDQRDKREDVGPFEVEMWTAEEKSAWGEANTSRIQYEGKPAVLMTLREVTSRKEAEDRRKISEQRFRSLVEHAGVPVGTSDLRGRFTYVNSAMAELTGYSIDEIVGQSFRRFVHPDDRKKVMRLFFNIILLRREPRAFEFRIIRKDGTIRHLWSKPTRFIVDGKTAGFQAIIVDMTGRKRMEDAFLESEKKYRLLVENANEAIVVAQDDILKFANPKAIEIMSYSIEESASRPFTDFIHPEDREMVINNYLRRLKGEQFPQVYSFRVIDKNGEVKWMEINAVAFTWENRPATLNFLNDITERKKMEDDLRRYSVHLEELVGARTSELRKSEQELRRIYNSSMNAIYTLNLTGQITDMNPAGINMLGVDSLSELKKFKLLDFCMKPEDSAQILKPGYKGPVKDYEMQIRRRDGRIIDVILNGYPVKDETGETAGIQGAIIDITERKELERRLIAAEKMAAVGETTAMVGHDLRNPLQAIMVASYTAKKRFETLPENVKTPAEGAGVHEILETIEHQVKYMNKIVADLQDYSRVIHPSLADVSLSQVIKDALSTTALPATVKIKTDLKKNLDGISADPDLLKRVFSNLINNAAQAMPDGGTLTIKASKKGQDVLIRFQDTGEGIPKENLDRLFDPFFTTKAKGQGLGLAVCKRLVEAHSGTITAESKVGKGSTFTVKLPQRKK